MASKGPLTASASCGESYPPLGRSSAERVPVGRRTRVMLLGARRGLAWSVSQQHPRNGQRGKVHQKCPGSGFRPKILLYRGALIKA